MCFAEEKEVSSINRNDTVPMYCNYADFVRESGDVIEESKVYPRNKATVTAQYVRNTVYWCIDTTLALFFILLLIK